ncbi:9276_t:CDS:2 [Ambispora gerdemannii]|uniref:9276_t:CDS:1 n=1 Tax=Ambispora gerdemannii TaxID=144530 RepID=A0A9N9G056_9GLOM|nr:9276_t:CDS:2 [Ambispora gerdemannii]
MQHKRSKSTRKTINVKVTPTETLDQKESTELTESGSSESSEVQQPPLPPAPTAETGKPLKMRLTVVSRATRSSKQTPEPEEISKNNGETNDNEKKPTTIQLVTKKSKRKRQEVTTDNQEKRASKAKRTTRSKAKPSTEIDDVKEEEQIKGEEHEASIFDVEEPKKKRKKNFSPIKKGARLIIKSKESSNYLTESSSSGEDDKKGTLIKNEATNEGTSFEDLLPEIGSQVAPVLIQRKSKTIFEKFNRKNKEKESNYEEGLNYDKHTEMTDSQVARVFSIKEKAEEEESNHDNDAELQKELRKIWNSIKNNRDSKGRQMTLLFETLPDKEEYPDYYEEIKQPIALDNIKSKINANEYLDMKAFHADFNLMFENAKTYNAEGSQIYQDAVQLQKLAQKLTGVKSNSSNSEDLEALEEIIYKGETYQIGDFVELVNKLDSTKPNLGHIYRMWKDAKGKEGIYVCWFYRPEQTVHQANRLFWENEIFKTNTFHDYSINDVIAKCFVLQPKDYQRGRPKGSEGKNVYLCESRYREVGKYYSKIKFWDKIIPEGARVGRPELELYPEVKVIKKVPSSLAMEAGATKPRILPSQTASQFDHDKDGKMIWFSAPPLDVIPLPKPRHSDHYLQYKVEQAEKQRKRKARHDAFFAPSKRQCLVGSDMIRIDDNILISLLQSLGEAYIQDASSF